MPVAVYAALFVCVNIAYLVFERQALRQADTMHMPERARRMAKRRSFATLSIFASAMLVSALRAACRLRADLLRAVPVSQA